MLENSKSKKACSAKPCLTRRSRGFSLVEVVFAASIFAVISISIYQGFISVTSLVSASRDKVVAVDLINEEFELIRNLSYANVGLIGGIPNGALVATTTVARDGREFGITRVIRNVDDPFDGTIGGSPNDSSPADYKLVQISVSCLTCKKSLNFSAVSNVSPKNLETASSNGALFIRVYDANGEPVPQADVHIGNSLLGISIDETTDNNGLLSIVDVPPAQNSYRIIATKNGFTTDRTYATSTSNPNPLKLDATVVLQQLTQISFIIDRTSDINLRTVSNTCASVPNVPFSASGAKLIGVNPDVYKWTGNFTTDSSGVKSISDVEWDIFSFAATGGFYLAGTNPMSPISVLPNSSQNIDLVISESSPAFLLVNVKDSATNLPISGANVSLAGGSYGQSLITDQGVLSQTDWSGGGWQSDGNIEANNPAGELKLVSSLGSFVPHGELTSAVFDTGASSNWTKISVQPVDQPPQAGTNSVRLQIATAPQNTATTTWNFLGPDGTVGSFYGVANENINSLHDGDRYIKYKIFLNTENTNFTPNISDVVISFSSSCIPPGQVLFSNLTSQEYSLEVTAPGFVSQTLPVNVNSDWQMQEVLLSP